MGRRADNIEQGIAPLGELTDKSEGQMRRTHRRDDDDGLMKVRIRGGCRILSVVQGNLSRPTRNWKIGGGGGGLTFHCFFNH